MSNPGFPKPTVSLAKAPALATVPPGRESSLGFVYGFGAHAIWGVVPLYFHAMAEIAPWVVLCHRVIWSVGCLALVIFAQRGWTALGLVLRERRNLILLSVSAILIGVNWLLFIYAISSGQALHASLGYFMNPLLSVALGRVFLGERLRPWQWVAVAIVLAAVVNLSMRESGFPWLAISLAVSFGFYGLVRKRVNVNSLHALMVESLILLAPAFVALAFFSNWNSWRPKAGLLSLAGVITATPLLMFGAAVRRLRLATMGFLQYVGPTLQFVMATFVFHEPLNRTKLLSFIICWSGIAVYVSEGIVRTTLDRHQSPNTSG
jgi:chloramphenicol-sensitive protein RarD